MNERVEKALAAIRANAARCTRTERYYDGRHDLRFATEKFRNTFGSLFREFSLNLCPVVCDAVRDKLEVDRFAHITGRDPDASAHAAARIWEDNRMTLRSGEVHKEALKNGDAYVIVWPDAYGRPAIYANRAAAMAVTSDDERPGRITEAAKVWRDPDGSMRLTLYYADRIERYRSERRDTTAGIEAGEFRPASDVVSVVDNPFGIVPVFHFANNEDLGQPGRSELESAIPIQDGLNKSVLDMLVAMEFAAFRQRWAAGIEVEIDQEGNAVAPFRAGVEHLWIAGDPNAKFGDFAAAELDQFLKVKDSFRVDIASVTGTPLHYLLPRTGGLPSGESLRMAESRFIAKVRDRQRAFGQVWSDVMEFALRTQGIAGVSLRTVWRDPAPLSERETLENIRIKAELGLPREAALAEAGYGTETGGKTNE